MVAEHGGGVVELGGGGVEGVAGGREGGVALATREHILFLVAALLMKR